MTSRLVALGAGLALALPSPDGLARTLTVPLCGGGVRSIEIPVEPAESDDHDCCRKACHAGDRRKRAGEDQGCC